MIGEKLLSVGDRQSVISVLSLQIAEIAHMSQAQYNTDVADNAIACLAYQMVDLLLDGGVGGQQASTNYKTYVELLHKELPLSIQNGHSERLRDIAHANETAACIVYSAKDFFDMSSSEYDGIKGERLSLQIASTLCSMMSNADSNRQVDRNVMVLQRVEERLKLAVCGSEGEEVMRYRLNSMTIWIAGMFHLHASLSKYKSKVAKTLKEGTFSDEDVGDGGDDQFDAMGRAIQVMASCTAGENKHVTGYRSCMKVVDKVELGSVNVGRGRSIFVELPKIRKLIHSMWLVRNDSPEQHLQNHPAINVRGDGSCFYQAFYYSMLWALPADKSVTYPTLAGLKKAMLDLLYDSNGHILLLQEDNIALHELVIVNDDSLNKTWAENVLKVEDRSWYANHDAIQIAAAAFNVQILIFEGGDGNSPLAKLSMAFPANNGKFTGAPVMMFLRTGTSYKTGHFYILGLHPIPNGITHDGRGIHGEKYPNELRFSFHNDHTPVPLLGARIEPDFRFGLFKKAFTATCT